MSCLCEVHLHQHTEAGRATVCGEMLLPNLKHQSPINADPTQHFLKTMSLGMIQKLRLQTTVTSMHLSLDPNRPLKQSRMTQHHPVQNQDLSPRTHKMKGEKRATSCIHKVYNLPKFDWFILGHWFWSSIFALLSTS